MWPGIALRPDYDALRRSVDTFPGERHDRAPAGRRRGTVGTGCVDRRPCHVKAVNDCFEATIGDNLGLSQRFGVYPALSMQAA